VSQIVENKRSISLDMDMVEDAIEDAREQLSDQVEVLFRDENHKDVAGIVTIGRYNMFVKIEIKSQKGKKNSYNGDYEDN
jgi:hypothetical protein